MAPVVMALFSPYVNAGGAAAAVSQTESANWLDCGIVSTNDSIRTDQRKQRGRAGKWESGPRQLMLEVLGLSHELASAAIGVREWM